MKLPNALRPAALGRFGVTVIAVLIAIYAGWLLWVHYEVDPWTRDGRVRAYVVEVAPDVSGLVTEVPVLDNQNVEPGQELFQIDRARYQLALDNAKTAVEQMQATYDQAQRDAKRALALGNLVATQSREQSDTKVESAKAGLDQARVQVAIAQLNLQRSHVISPVYGRVTNLALRVGSYAAVGKPVMTLVDLKSYYIEGYFEETKLQRIHVGDPVRMTLMGAPQTLTGHVESIALGITDRDRDASPNGLPNVNPTFTWVRLAQRIPVRIHIDHIPDGVTLVAGQTVTVVVDNKHTARQDNTQPSAQPAANSDTAGH